MHSSIQKAKIYKKIKEACLAESKKPETSKVLTYSKYNLLRTRNTNGKVR